MQCHGGLFIVGGIHGCLLAASLSLLLAQPVKPPIEGIWMGKIDAMGNKLRTVVTFTRSGDGALSAKISSPDQADVMDWPLQDVAFEDGEVRFTLKIVLGTFTGKMNDAGSEIAGTWTQGMEFPLVLKRVNKADLAKRPQEPSRPSPYKNGDGALANPAMQSKQAGTLAVSGGNGPFQVETAPRQQGAEYNIKNFAEKMLSWSIDAVDYNEYRWKKSSQELLDSFIGSTISIKGLQIEAAEIKITEGKAKYAHVYSLHDTFDVDPLMGRSTISGLRKTHSYELSHYGNEIQIVLLDNSDRLAMELAGKTRINLVGRITSAQLGGEYYYGLSVSIQITTWSKSE